MGLAVLTVGRLEIGCLCNYDSVVVPRLILHPNAELLLQDEACACTFSAYIYTEQMLC